MTTVSGFPCNQTPLEFQDAFDLSGITMLSNPFGNAGLRVWSLIKGAGNLSVPFDGVGVTVDENIQNSFTLNGVSYNLIDMRIIEGAHKIFPWANISGQVGSVLSKTGVYSTAPLEIHIFFKNNLNQIISLVLPIAIDDTKKSYASTYINSLNTSSGSTPLLSSLFKDLSGATPTETSFSFNSNNVVLQYIGQDIRTYGTVTCDPSSIVNPVTYIVIMNDIGDFTEKNKNATNLISSTITSNDYNAFVQKVRNVNARLALPGSIQEIDSSAGNLSKLSAYPSGVLYITNSNTGEGSSTISTSAVKCYPVDPSKNVKAGQLYLDMNGVPKDTLADEIATPYTIPDSTPSFWASATGIETIVGIIIAIIFVLVIATFFIRRNYTAIGITGAKIATKVSGVGSVVGSAVGPRVSAVGSTIGSAFGSFLSSILSNSTLIFASLFVMTLILCVIFIILYATK